MHDLHPMTKFIISVMFFAGFYSASSQSISRSVISSNGRFVSNSYAQLNSNVGEVLVTTLTSSSNFVTQGFLQPPNYLTTNVLLAEDQTNAFNLFPNPTESIITLSTKLEVKPFLIKVFDIQGRDLHLDFLFEKSPSENTLINVVFLNKGIYFLKVFDKNTYELIEVIRFVKI